MTAEGVFIDVPAKRVVKCVNTSKHHESRKEYAILSMLGAHTHIVKLLNYEEDPKRGPILYLEYGGVDLFYMQPRVGGQDQLCQHLLTQIREALQFLHSRHVAHMDVKIDNVVVDEHLTHARLIDFGLSSVHTEYVYTFEGTPEYACPEMWSTHPKVNVYASDVWSYGLLAFVLYHGLMPWHAARVDDCAFAAACANQRRGASPFSSMIAPARASPPWLQHHVNATLWIDPRRRAFPETTSGVYYPYC